MKCEASVKKEWTILIYIAVGIVLMVMGHIGFGKVFDILIHAFHMLMFCFVSGFLYLRRREG